MGDNEELRASRARIAAAAATDRRRFERALHDGVQQDLIALSVGLQLLLERLDDPAVARVHVEELRRETQASLGRVQRLADEIYPSLLDAHGLAGASERYAPTVEAAAALCCRAADPTGTATVTTREEDGRLVVEVRGPYADASLAARDLAAAAGATVTVEQNVFRAEFEL